MATLDWYGCGTFRLNVDGLTILLDAYIDRAEGAAGSGTSADDIDFCDWIVIGHSHFDHLYGAERIMANTNATLIGSYETIRVMEQAGVAADRMICVAGGETVRLSDTVTVSVYPSQHSCVWSHSQMSQADEVCLGDLGVTWQEQQARMADLGKYMTTQLSKPAIEHLLGSMAGQSPRGDGGALVYLFETPEGTLLADAALVEIMKSTLANYDPSTQQFTHQINLYADTTYYFLTVGLNQDTDRIQTRASVAPAYVFSKN